MKKILFSLVLMVSVLGFASPSGADSALDSIVDAVQESGRYVENDLSPSDSKAIDQANAKNMAFVWLNQPNRSDTDAADRADEVRTALTQRNSTYTTVLVLLDNGSRNFGVGASSDFKSKADIDRATAASERLFADKNITDGVETFTSSLFGSASDATAAPNEDGASQGSPAQQDNSTPAESSQPANSSEKSSGGGFLGLFILVAIVGLGLFIVFRVLKGRKKSKKQASTDMAEDRAEIEEQLKSNADRVISLGDSVIKKKDDELITLYEEASKAYQEVSVSLPKATSAEEVDALDDKIDKAEWQFDVIEAKLEGRAAPLSPEQQARQEELEKAEAQGRKPQDAATKGRPALGDDESVFGDRGRRSAPQRKQRQPGGLPGGLGGKGGGLGGVLGGVLGSILMGGGMGGSRPSRRTTRRRSGYSGSRSGGGFSDPFGGASRSSGRSKSRGGKGGGGFTRGGKGGGGFTR